MKKLLFILLCAVVILLSACAQQPAETVYTEPTLPSFPEEKTPLEILTAAANKTTSAASFTVTYGRISDGQEQTLEASDDFITNENFLQDFCSLSMTASPSNTGIIRYEITGLTGDQLYALLYGENTGSDSADNCSIAIQISADGYLTRIEYTVEQYQTEGSLINGETFYVQLSLAE